MKSALLLWSLLMCGICRAGQGPSFDCGRAASRIEKAICEDPALSQLDLEMSQLYRAQTQFQDKDEAKAEQGQWLVDRNRCDFPAEKSFNKCLKDSYETRIKQFRRETKLYPCQVLGAGNDAKLELSERETGGAFRIALLQQGGTILATLKPSQIPESVLDECGSVDFRSDLVTVKCADKWIQMSWYMAHLDTKLVLKYSNGKLTAKSCEHFLGG